LGDRPNLGNKNADDLLKGKRGRMELEELKKEVEEFIRKLERTPQKIARPPIKSPMPTSRRQSGIRGGLRFETGRGDKNGTN